jgi:hypothetical protein
MGLHPVSRRAGHEIVGRVTEGRQRRERSSRSATPSAWAASSTRAAPARLPRRPRAVLRRHGHDLRQHGQAPQRPDPRRLLAEHRRDGGLRPADAGQPRPRRRRAAAVRGHHHLFPAAHWKVGPGQKVGIVGLGGLGHMGVKFAKAFGAHVVLFTTSPGKAADALAARRARGRHLQGRRADGGARRQLRLHPRHRLRRRTTSTPTSTC